MVDVQSEFREFLKTCCVTLRFDYQESTDDAGNIIKTFAIDRVPIYSTYKLSEIIEYTCSRKAMIEIMNSLWHFINRRPTDSIVELMKQKRDIKYWTAMMNKIETETEGETEAELELFKKSVHDLKLEIDALNNHSVSNSNEYYGQLEMAVVNFLSTIEPLIE